MSKCLFLPSAKGLLVCPWAVYALRRAGILSNGVMLRRMGCGLSR